jgi:hypothetical protein
MFQEWPRTLNCPCLHREALLARFQESVIQSQKSKQFEQVYLGFGRVGLSHWRSGYDEIGCTPSLEGRLAGFGPRQRLRQRNFDHVAPRNFHVLHQSMLRQRVLLLGCDPLLSLCGASWANRTMSQSAFPVPPASAP